ncbi:MAG: dTDP-glucose 4,6-dehydratase [Acidimicrobiia bacterium]
MKVLVTGGCGFIGSHLCRMLLARGDFEVTNLDALTYAADPLALAEFHSDSRYRFVKGDICEWETVIEAMQGCEVVFHLAAESFVDRSLHRAAEFVRTNVDGTALLLEAARQLGVRRFVHVGTDEVYGSQDDPGEKATETSSLEPSSPYSASKAAGDLLALAAHRSYGQDVVVTRCSNNYGPRQFPEKLIPLTIVNLFDGVEVPIYGDGRQVRDWLFVEDHCTALLTALEKGKAGEVYNIAAEQDPEWTNLDVVKALVRMTGANANLVRFVEDRPGHDRRYAMSSSKIRELGWSPSLSLEEGLERTVSWYKANEDWWRPRLPKERSVPQHKWAGVHK